MHMFACVWVCVHMEGRGQFFTFHPSFILRQSLMNLEAH